MKNPYTKAVLAFASLYMDNFGNREKMERYASLWAHYLDREIDWNRAYGKTVSECLETQAKVKERK